MKRDTILTRLNQLNKLTASEAKIAELFERSYPLTAFETVTSISDKARVGKATVVRFISRLGYKKFSDFQEEQRRELIRRLASPYGRLSEVNEHFAGSKVDFLGKYITQVQISMEEAHSRLDPEQIMAAARLMANCRGSLYATGQGESHAMAYVFWNQAMYLRQRVYLIDNLNSALPLQLIDVSKNDVLFAICRERYGYQTNRICRWFAERGAKVILLADREVTPSTESAHIQLVARSEDPTMFRSNGPRLAVVESLTWIISTLLKNKINRRFEVCENLIEDFSVFLPWTYETAQNNELESIPKPIRPKKRKKND